MLDKRIKRVWCYSPSLSFFASSLFSHLRPFQHALLLFVSYPLIGNEEIGKEGLTLTSRLPHPEVPHNSFHCHAYPNGNAYKPGHRLSWVILMLVKEKKRKRKRSPRSKKKVGLLPPPLSSSLFLPSPSFSFLHFTQGPASNLHSYPKHIITNTMSSSRNTGGTTSPLLF